MFHLFTYCSYSNVNATSFITSSTIVPVDNCHILVRSKFSNRSRMLIKSFWLSLGTLTEGESTSAEGSDADSSDADTTVEEPATNDRQDLLDGDTTEVAETLFVTAAN